MAILSTEEVIQTLTAIIQEYKPPAPVMPDPVILAGGFTRKGLSARDMAKEIIIRQSEAGAPVGPLNDGSDNISEKMELIRMEVIIRYLLEEARISVVIPPGIPVTTAGTSPAGPVITQGTTVSYAKGTAIIQ